MQTHTWGLQKASDHHIGRRHDCLLNLQLRPRISSRNINIVWHGHPVCGLFSYSKPAVLLTLASQGFKRVQNQLARPVTNSPLFTPSLPLLRFLHWLPVRFRILFKVNLLTYKTLRENSLFVFTPCWLHRFLPIN